jgi:hypothetical protein
MADIKDTTATKTTAPAAKVTKAAPAPSTPSIGAHFSESLSLQSVRSKISSVEKAGEGALSKGIQDLKDIMGELLSRMGLSHLVDASREEDKKKEKEETKKKEEAAWYARGEQIARSRYMELHQAA